MTHTMLMLTGLVDCPQAGLDAPWTTHEGLRADVVRLAADAGMPNAEATSTDSLLWLIEPLAQLRPEPVFAVLYEAPWIAFDRLAAQDRARFLTDPCSALADWIQYHKEALRLARRLGSRVMLLNASHLEDGTALRQYCADAHGLILPAPSTPPVAGTAPPLVHEAHAYALSILLSTMAPECCDVYEMLESCALLFGREPEFRQGIAMPQDDPLTHVLQRWLQPQQVALNQLSLQAQQREMRQLRQELQISRDRETALADELAAAQSLARLRMEDDQANLAAIAAALHAIHVDATQAVPNAAPADSAATPPRLELAIANLRQLYQQLLQGWQNEQDNSSALLLQLHQTQEMLEAAFVESTEMHDLMARTQASFTRARHLLAQPRRRPGNWN